MDSNERSKYAPVVAVFVVLLIGTCLALWGQGRQDRVSSDRYDVRSQALVADDGIEGHAAWVLDMLNGAPLSLSEIEARLSPRFQLSISPQDFLITTRALAESGPYEQRGFTIESDLGQQVFRTALFTAGGDVQNLTLAWNPSEPKRIQGMTLLEGESERGPFSSIEALAHLVASWGLAGAGVVLWLNATRRFAGQLLMGAGLLWMAQFLELTNTAVPYTLGLVAGPVAAFVVVLAVVRLGPTRGDAGGKGVLIAAGIAAVASVSTLLVIDTSVAELPDQLLSITHNGQTARLLGAFEQGATLIAACGLAVLLWVRERRQPGEQPRFAQMLALLGTAMAVVVVFLAGWGLSGEHHDLSMSPLMSVAAMGVPAGIGIQTVREALVVTELRSSRTRILESAERARREIERDLHDGAQQRLIALQLSLKLEQNRAERSGDLVDTSFLQAVSDELGGAITELRELGRGLRPSALDHGLRAAVESLAERSPVPIVTDVSAQAAPKAVESAAYFVINEAIANATRHSQADHVRVTTKLNGTALHVEIADDGVGGAGKGTGTGLQSLEDRVVALNGTFVVDSPSGSGTRVLAALPINEEIVEHG